MLLSVFQLIAMQEKMRKLVEESGKKKKEKKKQKDKDGKGGKKLVANSSSNLGKPGAHGALAKANSIMATDSVDDSIASVVSGADLKMADLHHPAGSKALAMHHSMAAAGNAANKPPKSKGQAHSFKFKFAR